MLRTVWQHSLEIGLALMLTCSPAAFGKQDGSDNSHAPHFQLQRTPAFSKADGEKATSQLTSPADHDRLMKLSDSQQSRGDLTSATLSAEMALTLRKQVLGHVHADVAATLQYLADLKIRQEDFGKARTFQAEVLAIHARLYHSTDWRVTDARRGLSDIDALVKIGRAKRLRLSDANRLLVRVADLASQAKHAEALPLAQQALAIYDNVLGVRNLLSAKALLWIGYIYSAQHESRMAVSTYERVSSR